MLTLRSSRPRRGRSAAPHRRWLLAAFAIVCGLIAALPAPALAASPKLRVSRPAVAPYAHPGGSLPVRLAVARRRGRVRRAAITLYLSSDARRDEQDRAFGKPRTVRRLTAKRQRRRVTTTPTIPADLATGTYRVIACAGVGRGKHQRTTCAASATVIVTADAVTTADRLQAAVKAGRLSLGRALRYRLALALTARQPPRRYQGDPAAPFDDAVVREATNAWPQLSARDRTKLLPFLLPPAARASWAALRGHAKARAAAAPGGECDSARYHRQARGWRNITAADGKVRLWWDAGRSGQARRAAAFVPAATLAFQRFKELMGRTPLADGSTRCFHGSDAALDIYLAPRRVDASNTSILAYTIPYPDSRGCAATPGFVVMSPNAERLALVHEIFHAFQFAFPSTDCGGWDYGSLLEDTAQWSENYVYPEDDHEHDRHELLDDPTLQLGGLRYEGWVFYLALEKQHGAETIRRIFENLQSHRALAAVDAGSGGLDERWKEFALAGWNQDPVARFASWDRLPNVPQREGGGGPEQPVDMSLNGASVRTEDVPYPGVVLRRRYRAYRFEHRIREVQLRNPMASAAGASVQAILTYADGHRGVEDWSARSDVTLCRDEPDQDVQELVLVVATGYADGAAAFKPAQLVMRDTCPVPSYVIKAVSLHQTFSGSQDQGFCSSPVGGQERFTAELASPAPADLQTNRMTIDPDTGEVSGDITLNVPATWDSDLHGCTLPPPDYVEQPCTAQRHELPEPDGVWRVGLTFTAPSRDAGSATVQWLGQDPDVGYIDADDDVCNVNEFGNTVENAVLEQPVALSTFESGTQTLTFTGGPVTLTSDLLGRAMDLTATWTYSITFQAVDDQGNPL
ncbi:MAG TPA: hypothetical protein VFT50_17120 [Baekduia sp.]|nr:hypothetical protein [Baekduia sp.]